MFAVAEGMDTWRMFLFLDPVVGSWPTTYPMVSAIPHDFVVRFGFYCGVKNGGGLCACRRS